MLTKRRYGCVGGEQVENMDDRKELDAFFHFFATFDLSRPVSTPSDLSDGAALSDILAIAYVCILIPLHISQLMNALAIRGILRRQGRQLILLTIGS